MYEKFSLALCTLDRRGTRIVPRPPLPFFPGYGRACTPVTFIPFCPPSCRPWFPGFLSPWKNGSLQGRVSCLLGFRCGAGRKRKAGNGPLRAEAELLVGVYLWFYVGWGINYFRKDFFTRSSLEYVAYQDSTFHHFLADYTRRLNQAYTQSPFPSHEVIEKEAKQLFAQVPSRFGLSSPKAYQHPKQVMFNTLYSGVGVLGYMGPFFAESQLNREPAFLAMAVHLCP